MRERTQFEIHKVFHLSVPVVTQVRVDTYCQIHSDLTEIFGEVYGSGVREKSENSEASDTDTDLFDNPE